MLRATDAVGATADLAFNVTVNAVIALDPSVSNVTYANTSTIRSKLAAVRAGTGSMKILNIGDSTDESGSAASGNNRLYAVSGRMAVRLAALGLPAKFDNYLGGAEIAPTAAGYAAYAPGVTFTGSATGFSAGFTMGGPPFGLIDPTPSSISFPELHRHQPLSREVYAVFQCWRLLLLG